MDSPKASVNVSMPGQEPMATPTDHKAPDVHNSPGLVDSKHPCAASPNNLSLEKIEPTELLPAMLHASHPYHRKGLHPISVP